MIIKENKHGTLDKIKRVQEVGTCTVSAKVDERSS